jgi:hypothetical protein
MLQINIFFMFLDHFDTLVATQFFTHVFDNFLEKTKNSKKNKENPKKKMHFDIFTSFLAFSISSQKNFNFQRYFKHVQLLTH